MHSKSLKSAARACGIALSYEGPEKSSVRPEDITIKRLLLALSGNDSPENILSNIRNDIIRRGLNQTIISWNGSAPVIWIWHDRIPDKISAEVTSGNGQAIPFELKVHDYIKREDRYRLRLTGFPDLEFGYYDFELFLDETAYSSFVISAPLQIRSSQKNWGVFAPVYAIRSKSNQGIGGYKELYDAGVFIKEKGGSFIGTLPLLAVNHSNGDHSPYAPVSRLFWNDIFLDITDLPGCIPDKEDFTTLNETSHVDYETIYKKKKAILQKAADNFFEKNLDSDKDFKKFIANSKYIHEYAAHTKNINYILYSQYACHLQIKKLQSSQSAQLYLDYPVGVHADGFDSRHFSQLFIQGFTVGAPPDKLGPKGQNWGFRPLNPQAVIDNKFQYFRESIQHYFSYAKMLRIDHVMGLYRIYCIPDGEESAKGAYIYYPFDALLAVLCLEAFRNNGIVIGENLGTVPETVNKAMKKHGIPRMWISQFEMKETPEETFESIEPDMIAGMNTHDTFPFEAVKNNIDLDQLSALDILSKDEAAIIATDRKEFMSQWKSGSQNYMNILEKMAASPANYMIINMEDLWQETMPQNIPGTTTSYPNWSKKFALPLEQWPDDKNIKNAFNILNDHRGQS